MFGMATAIRTVACTDRLSTVDDSIDMYSFDFYLFSYIVTSAR